MAKVLAKICMRMGRTELSRLDRNNINRLVHYDDGGNECLARHRDMRYVICIISKCCRT